MSSLLRHAKKLLKIFFWYIGVAVTNIILLLVSLVLGIFVVLGILSFLYLYCIGEALDGWNKNYLRHPTLSH